MQCTLVRQGGAEVHAPIYRRCTPALPDPIHADLGGVRLLHTEPEEGGIVGRSELKADAAIDH